MFNKAFSSFSVSNIERAKDFYGEILGLDVRNKKDMGLMVHVDKHKVFIYPKDDHEPATFTVLNLMVDDIDDAVDKLTDKGIEFEHYSGEMETDDKGIARGKDNRPSIAWFKDPFGNFLAVLEE